MQIFSLLRIIITLARYRALFLLEPFRGGALVIALSKLIPAQKDVKYLRNGQRLARALEVMGPSFIKLGQTLSARTDLVGDDVAADLARLRDALPSFPASQARMIIEQDLRKSITEIYREFNDVPVAAASIAQVHEAVTTEGVRVAVKVVRPNVAKEFARDIALFFWLAHFVEKRLPHYRRLKPIEVIETFRQSVMLEMDLRFEAAAASELKENCANDPQLYIPSIDWQRTSHHVMTMEWVEGIPIDDKDALLAKGFDLQMIIANLATGFFNQAFRDGFFHADMHPGNLFVNDQGQIILVDFGIMGRIDRDTRVYVAEIIRGFLQRDYHYVARLHFAAGYVPKHQSIDVFAQACRSIGEPIIGLPLNQLSIAQLLAQLFKITEDFQMETQPQLLLLQKTMVLVEGVGASLYPQVNMWKLAEPWINAWAGDNLGVTAKIKDGAFDIAGFLYRLPDHIKRLESFSQCITPEGFKLHPDSFPILLKKRHLPWKVIVVSGVVSAIVAVCVGVLH